MSTDNPERYITKVLYKEIRERVRQLRMQFTEPLAAILLEQQEEEPTEDW